MTCLHYCVNSRVSIHCFRNHEVLAKKAGGVRREHTTDLQHKAVQVTFGRDAPAEKVVME